VLRSVRDEVVGVFVRFRAPLQPKINWLNLINSFFFFNTLYLSKLFFFVK
jgi:hypothetical protein